MPILRHPAVLVAALALAVSPALASAVAWTPAADVATGQACSGGSAGCGAVGVGTAADGATTAVWLDTNGNTIKVSTRAAGDGAFGAPVTVATVASPVSGSYEDGPYASIAVADDGTTLLAWRDGNTIKSAVREQGAATFTAPANVVVFGATTWPSIAVGGDGVATVVWVGPSGAVFAARRPATPGSAFGSPEQIASSGAQPYRPMVATAPDGTTVAAWYGNGTLEHSTWSGAWAQQPTVINDVGARTAALAAGADNALALAWQSTAGTSPVVAAIRPAGAASSFGAPLQVSATGTVPDVAIDTDGAATVVWRDSLGGGLGYFASSLPAGGGTFSAPVTISADADGGQPPYPQIAASGDGSVTTAYMKGPSFPSGAYAIETRTRPAGAANFDSAVVQAGASDGPDFFYTPQLAGGPGNLVTVAWPSVGGVSVFAAWTLPPQYDLTVARAGAGSGAITSSPAAIDCGPTCVAPFTDGSSVTLTATPASGSTFAGWSGGGCSGTGTCAVTMTAAQSVTATFDLVPAGAGGNTTPSSGGQSGNEFPAELGVSVPPGLARAGLPVSAGGTVGLPLACPSGIPGGCDASGVLSTTLPAASQAQRRKRDQASRTRVLARFRGVEIAAGKRRLYTVRLDPATYTRLRRAGVRRVPATLRVVNSLENGTSAITRERVWLRIRPLAVPVAG